MTVMTVMTVVLTTKAQMNKKVAVRRNTATLYNTRHYIENNDSIIPFSDSLTVPLTVTSGIIPQKG